MVTSHATSVFPTRSTKVSLFLRTISCGRYRPACLISHTGGRSTSSPLKARRKRSFFNSGKFCAVISINLRPSIRLEGKWLRVFLLLMEDRSGEFQHGFNRSFRRDKYMFPRLNTEDRKSVV